MCIPALVREVVEKGIEVSIVHLRNGEIAFDLGSGTKSAMNYIESEDGTSLIIGRYGEQDTVNDFDDLLIIFASRYRAKQFGDKRWIELAGERGYLKKHIKTEYY